MRFLPLRAMQKHHIVCLVPQRLVQTTRPTLLFRVSDIANVLKKCTQVGTRRSLRLRWRATWRWRTSRRPSCRATMKWSMWARQLGSGMLKPPIPAAESFNLIRPCRFFICMQVRVQLPGKATQKIFDEALTFLARDAPPVPGFRKSKGGTEAPHNLSSYDGILAWHLRSCFLTRINYICFHEVIQTSDIFSASSAWTFRENIKCKCLQTSVFPVRHPFNCTVSLLFHAYAFTWRSQVQNHSTAFYQPSKHEMLFKMTHTLFLKQKYTLLFQSTSQSKTSTSSCWQLDFNR